MYPGGKIRKEEEKEGKRRERGGKEEGKRRERGRRQTLLRVDTEDLKDFDSSNTNVPVNRSNSLPGQVGQKNNSLL